MNTRDRKLKQEIGQYANYRRNAKEIEVKEGDTVLVKNLRKNTKIDAVWENKPYQVTKEYKSSVKVTNERGQDFVRSKAHIKKYKSKVQNQFEKTTTQRPVSYQIPATPVLSMFIPPDVVENPHNSDQESENSENEEGNSDDSVETEPYEEGDVDWNILEPKSPPRQRRHIRRPLRFNDYEPY